MVAEPGQRIRESQIRVFLAWLTGAKRRLHHASVLMSVFSARLAAKRLGKVSEKRFSFGLKVARVAGAGSAFERIADLPKIFVYA
ncbi:hypothetical protein [Mesorhizobium sp. GbtcB19]|uniref:hypothetical protein n=1 Tax=Mesorhizobium sp. GbtcB19 TaxID=2824764 RepID=UPI001C307872|nr:hypothetical protein [Mesorhizobium sp. GbtcB19]